MPSAILDLDLTRPLPDGCDVSPYTRAFVVLRFHGTPVGHCWLDAPGGRLARDVLHREALRAALPALSRRLLEQRLGLDTRPAGAAPPDATLAICTRDRPADLETCLAAAAGLDPAPREILVVDNCPSSGAAAAVARRFPAVRYVLEPRAGLNVARNRALSEARTAVVAFCDDDAAVEREWLGALLRGFDHPLVMIVTGLTLPRELETESQEWFERLSPFGRGYFPRTFDPMHQAPHGAGQAGAGANMAVRRDARRLVGPFDERLDAGTPTHSGGDHEYFARVMRRGYRLFYDPAAVSWHRHRRSWHELRSTLRGYGTGVYATWTGQLARGELAVLKQAGWWLARQQLPRLACSVARRPGAPPAALVLDELRGCAAGPLAWVRSARRRKRERAA